MKMQKYASGSPWEEIAGYSRLVRAGNHLYVSGTTAFGEDGRLVGTGDAAQQTRRILENIGVALARAGASMEDVVRVRAYVVYREDMEIVARTLGSVFGSIRPANTTVGAAWLADPDMLVEIEVEALTASGDDD
jgi:enamine deaminase RidA (YjgF/YER057c/UK114 family)